MPRLLLSLIALALLLPPTARSEPAALPPPPDQVQVTPLPGGAWRLEWAQPSNAPTILVTASWYAEIRAGAPSHTVIIPGRVGWRPGLPLTIYEDFPGEAIDEIYPQAPAVLDQALYLPALARR